MTKSRKKMLLSSIAMLLVALVALGSATYAWYITNATVHAENAEFSASAADGLVIRTNRQGIAGDWKSDKIDLLTKSSLTPASYNYGAWGTLVGGTGQGTSFSDGTLSGAMTKLDNNAIVAETGNDYFLVDKFDVASTNAAITAKARLHVISVPSNASYLNLAVYYGDTLQRVYTTSSDTAPTSTDKVAAEGASSVKTDTAKYTNLIKVTADTYYDLPDFTAKSKAADGQQIRILAFADGYDENCTNEQANTNGLKVTFDFTTNTSW